MHRFHLNAFEGAIFDLDGTLVDSMPLWDRMGSLYIRSKGLRPEKNLDKILYPLSLIEAAEYLCTRYKLTADRQTVINECNAVMEKLYADNAVLKPGVREFLALIKKQNIPAVIATATDRHLAESVLRHLNIADFFKGIVTSTEAGSSKAQSAQIFHLARHIIGSAVHKTVVFEDAFAAVCTAKKAGYPVAAVYDRSADDTREQAEQTADWYERDFFAYLSGA
ncbi:HAD family hydrolase [Treponema sp. OMZ 840]|uniref:HAD family hydrolase n=1 Tax=Treponema sp. OMZ 840 TaxID=244313 RepID=UPI003D8D2898